MFYWLDAPGGDKFHSYRKKSTFQAARIEDPALFEARFGLLNASYRIQSLQTPRENREEIRYLPVGGLVQDAEGAAKRNNE